MFKTWQINWSQKLQNSKRYSVEWYIWTRLRDDPAGFAATKDLLENQVFFLVYEAILSLVLPARNHHLITASFHSFSKIGEATTDHSWSPEEGMAETPSFFLQEI